jgi:LDH2 family malate/lactate/ureidoglycolate dehydrogenase
MIPPNIDRSGKRHGSTDTNGRPGRRARCYKGYGYATVVEILSASLQQGAFLKALTGFDMTATSSLIDWPFFMAVQIEAFTEVDLFKKSVGDILRAPAQFRKAPGEERIYTAV